MTWGWRVAGVLVPVALAVALITTNVRLATGSITLWDALFERHHVAERTGIAPGDLRNVGREVQEYFDGDAEPFQVVARVQGQERPLFSRQEALHMSDVRGLFHLTWRVQEASILFLALMVGAAFLRYRRRAWSDVGRWARHGAVLAGVFVVAVGLISAVAFGPLFDLFHNIGFRNDLWQLDPNRDFLVMIFPFGFWRDITLLIGVATLVEAAVLFGAGRLLGNLFLGRGVPLASPRGESR